MSERSSFVTQYIYCQECFAAATEVLSELDKFHCAGPLAQQWNNEQLPIIAGKWGDLDPDAELHEFFKLMKHLSTKICGNHSLRIVLIQEDKRQPFNVSVFTLKEGTATHRHG